MVVTALVVGALASAAAAHADPVFVVKGRGWGHGIGMGQYGAQGFAQQGWGHERILLHYYPGTRLGSAEPRQVRVLLAESAKRVEISSPRPFRIVDGAGRTATLPARKLALGPGLVVKLRGKDVRLRAPVRFEGGAAPVALDGKPYRGALVVRAGGGSLTVVNHVTLERYLNGVVPYEMPNHWHPEALKAQAVVARSYALATLAPKQHWDLYDDQRSQVYGGVAAETPATNRAVGATAGRVLFHGGRIATTFYHSTSGGRTANVTDVWPRAEPVPYLRAVDDPHDRRSPHHTWGPVRLTGAQLAARLGAPALARAADLTVTRNASDRVAQVRVRTPQGTRAVDPTEFRRALELRSTWFQVGVLDLRAPGTKAERGEPVELRGIARNLEAPVIQRRDGGTWRQVARVRPGADGAFTVSVRAGDGGVFRVAAERIAGPEVRVEVAAARKPAGYRALDAAALARLLPE